MMHESLILVSRLNLKLEDLSSGTEYGKVKDEICLAVNPRAIFQIDCSYFGWVEESKPLLRVYRLDKLDSPYKRFPLPESIAAADMCQNAVIFAAAALRSPKLYMWNFSSGQLLKVIQLENAASLVKISSCCNFIHVAAKSILSTYLIADLLRSSDRIEPLVRFNCHRCDIQAFDCWSNGRAFVCVSGDSGGSVYISRSPDEVLSYITMASGISCVSFDPFNCNRAFVCLTNGEIKEIDIIKAKKLHQAYPLAGAEFPSFLKHDRPVTRCTLSKSGSLLVTISENRLVIWNRLSRQPHRSTAPYPNDPIVWVGTMGRNESPDETANELSHVRPIQKAKPIPNIKSLQTHMSEGNIEIAPFSWKQSNLLFMDCASSWDGQRTEIIEEIRKEIKQTELCKQDQEKVVNLSRAINKLESVVTTICHATTQVRVEKEEIPSGIWPNIIKAVSGPESIPAAVKVTEAQKMQILNSPNFYTEAHPEWAKKK